MNHGESGGKEDRIVAANDDEASTLYVGNGDDDDEESEFSISAPPLTSLEAREAAASLVIGGDDSSGNDENDEGDEKDLERQHALASSVASVMPNPERGTAIPTDMVAKSTRVAAIPATTEQLEEATSRGHDESDRQPGAIWIAGSASVRNDLEQYQDEIDTDETSQVMQDREEEALQSPPLVEAHLVVEAPPAPPPPEEPEPTPSLHVQRVVMDEESREFSESPPSDRSAAFDTTTRTTTIPNSPDPIFVEASPLFENHSSLSLEEIKPRPLWKHPQFFLVALALIIVTVTATIGIAYGLSNRRNYGNAKPELEDDDLKDNDGDESIGTTRESFVNDVLPDYTVAALDDPLSPQSLVLESLWDDPEETAAFPLYRRIQKYALGVVILSSTGTRSYPNLSELGDNDECTWPQPLAGNVVCQNSRIVLLVLDNSLLFRGTIPPEIALLTDLRMTESSDNLLKGPIPSQFGLLSDSVHELMISKTRVSGAIPSEIGAMTKLSQLNLSENDLTSTIPTEFGRLTNLRKLFLQGNNLSGPLPAELAQLSEQLEDLQVHGNINVNGTLPTEVGAMTSLTRLSIKNTNVAGPIPSELGLLSSSNLQELLFSTTALTGTIPTELRFLTQLERLELHDSLLNGPFPLCNLLPHNDGGGQLMEVTIDCERVQCDCNCVCI